MPEMAESNVFSQTPAMLRASPWPSLTISTPTGRRQSFVLNSGFDFASPSSGGKDNVSLSRKMNFGKSRLPSWYPRTALRDITAIVNELERRRRRRRRRTAARGNEESVTNSPITPIAVAPDAADLSSAPNGTAEVESGVTEGTDTQNRNSPPIVIDPATVAEIEDSPGTPITDAVELSSVRNATEEIGSGAREGTNSENGNLFPVVVDPETLLAIIEEIDVSVAEPSILQTNTGEEIEAVITREMNSRNILPLQIYVDPDTPATAPSQERTLNSRASETTRLVSIAEKKDRALNSKKGSKFEEKASAMPVEEEQFDEFAVR